MEDHSHRHPTGLYWLSIIALFGNFVYWGATSQMPLYLINQFKFSDNKASAIYSLTIALASLLQILTGWLSTQFRKFSYSIYFAFLCLLTGSILFAFNTPTFYFIGVVIFSIGYAVFWPAIYALQSQVYRNHPELRDSGFSLFFGIASIGIFLSQASSTSVISATSWSTFYILYGLAAILGIFAMLFSQSRLADANHTQSAQSCPNAKTQALSSEDKRKLLVLGILLFFSVVFWFNCSQMGGSALVIIRSYVFRAFPGLPIPELWFVSFFALTVIIAAPFFAMLWRRLDRSRHNISPVGKLSLSLFIVSLSLIVLWMISRPALLENMNETMLVVCLFGFYFSQAIAEIIFGPIGLSLATRMAPPKLLGAVTGLWLFTIGLGALISSGLVNWLWAPLGANGYITLMLVTSLTATVLLFLLSKTRLIRQSTVTTRS